MKKKYAPGWKQVIPKESISVRDLYDYLTNLLQEKETQKRRPWTGIKHYKGIDEQGFHYSYYDLGGHGLVGDAGYEHFCKAVYEQAKSVLIADKHHAKN